MGEHVLFHVCLIKPWEIPIKRIYMLIKHVLRLGFTTKVNKYVM